MPHRGPGTREPFLVQMTFTQEPGWLMLLLRLLGRSAPSLVLGCGAASTPGGVRAEGGASPPAEDHTRSPSCAADAAISPAVGVGLGAAALHFFVHLSHFPFLSRFPPCSVVLAGCGLALERKVSPLLSQEAP